MFVQIIFWHIWEYTNKRLINRAPALGLFAFIFFLNLLAPGSWEASAHSPDTYFQLSASSSGTEKTPIAEEVITLGREGILQIKIEISESLQLVRKYPAAVSLLFLLIQQNVVAVPDQSYTLCLGFSPPKDLLTSYHVLRI